MRYTNNHFLTLVEPFDQRLETIVSFRHARVIRQFPTVYLGSREGKWLEFVHEDNVSNDFRINIKVWNIPVLYGRSFRDFGLTLRGHVLKQWFGTLFFVPTCFLATATRRLKEKLKKYLHKR